MKKTLYLLLFVPMIGFGQNNEDINCLFTYKIQLKGSVIDCPYLGREMVREFTKLNPCKINKDDTIESITFTLDTIYSSSYIRTILIDLGIPKLSIEDIEIN